MPNPKQKGSQFERVIAKELSLWWSKGTRDDIFWRTATSGGRATVRGKQGKPTEGQSGDIASTHPSGKDLTSLVVIEIKRGYPKLNPLDLIDTAKHRANSILTKWVEQATIAQYQADTFGWWLIIKRDGRVPLVLMNWRIFRSFFHGRNLHNPGHILLTVPIADLVYGKGGKISARCIAVCGMQLDRFFATVKPSQIKALAIQWRRAVEDA